MRDLADTTSQKLQDIWVDMETNPQKDHKGKIWADAILEPTCIYRSNWAD